MNKSLVALILTCAPLLRSADVFEAALGREAELPGGKEADGIRGDFVLRNDKVEAVISHNAPNRRANMSTFYGEDGVSPGCLYDLTLRGANNDQLVAFGPAGHGPVSFVRILEGQPNGEAAVESVATAAMNGGVYKRNEFRVKDGIQGVFITTTLKNETDKPQKIATKSDLTRFNSTGTTIEGIYWADAINPAHKCGYALASLKTEGADSVGDSIELAPGQKVVKSRFFAVGTSPAQAIGEALAAKGVALGTVTGRIADGDGQPVTTATIQVPLRTGAVAAYVDVNGAYNLKLPHGEMELKVQDLGRTDTTIKVAVGEEPFTAPAATLSDAAHIRFDITDEAGLSIPCKAHFEPLDANAPKLNLGPKERAHGCVDQYHSEKGQFTVQLPPGKYRVVVVRGPEYGHLAQQITVPESWVR